jgi:DNA-binding MarR family transcriptional regulator
LTQISDSIIVHIMNKKSANNTDTRIVEYQSNKLQQLIADIHGCCKERIYLEAKMFNLPASELKCLMLFEGHKYLTAVEIAGKLEVAKSRATVILDSLAKRGFIQRVPDPSDARVKLVSLTRAGFKKIEEIEDFVFHLYHQLLSQIEPTQRPGVLAALEILTTSMKTMKAQMEATL